jgi:ABC-type glutathione transport system ATPase component
LADEPTGELDTTTSHEIFELLREANREFGVTILVVTHDPLVSEQVSRTVAIRDGRTSTETLRRRASAEAGGHVISQEYAVLDRRPAAARICRRVGPGAGFAWSSRRTTSAYG